MSELYRRYHIDGDLTEKILHAINTSGQDSTESRSSSAHTHQFPVINGVDIINGDHGVSLTLPSSTAMNHIRAIDPEIDLSAIGTRQSDGQLSFSQDQLNLLGIHLLPYLAYGILNGGSATSYIDSKKNSSFYPPLFSLIQDRFATIASKCSHTAKGLTPAYINPDGSAGFSFLELKMRAVLVQEILVKKVTGRFCSIPLFQMTSDFTHTQLLEHYERFRHSPLLEDLIAYTGNNIVQVLSAKQPLIAAFTSASEGFPRRVFTNAHGKPNSLLALPGGHGQNFYVLKEIYKSLYDNGKRFVYLVNVDNLGNTPSPIYLAIAALTGCDGAFEFSYKSPIDVKGGVLVKTEEGSLTCKDIGVAIPPAEISQAEADGKPILFNCATGLFNLTYLTDHIDEIIARLPLRVSEQNKDAGRYAQAEQVTWEIIDLMEHPTIIAVRKRDRFLAAKLLTESIMTTQASSIVPKLLEANPDYRDFCDVSTELEQGFYHIMHQRYKMKLVDRVWVPLSIAEIEASF